MNIPDLARYLQLAPVTVYKLVRENKIPVTRIGKSLRFPKAMIDGWLADQQKMKRVVPITIPEAVSLFAKKVRSQFRKQIMEIRLYGSFARHEEQPDSDMDVALIVCQKNLALIRSISQIASDVSLETDRLISVTVLEETAYHRGINEGYPFYVNIQKEGIAV